MEEKKLDILSKGYQDKWANHLFYDNKVFQSIDPTVHLHNDIKNPRSSAASCINVLANLGKKENKNDLKEFLNYFGLGIDEIISFPTGVKVDGQVYNDIGNVIFEWTGPKDSPINETGGKRGQNRTSVDAYILAIINNKIVQILIEWKFTEKYDSSVHLHKFGGLRGIERMRRYSTVLNNLRHKKDNLFNMKDEDQFGIYDFNYEPLYQLLRITLLAKMTTPIKLGDLEIEDYRIVHLTHSKNDKINYLNQKHLTYSPSIRKYENSRLHDIWGDVILSQSEKIKFRYGYWDQAIKVISDINLKEYLIKRYV